MIVSDIVGVVFGVVFFLVFLMFLFFEYRKAEKQRNIWNEFLESSIKLNKLKIENFTGGSQDGS